MTETNATARKAPHAGRELPSQDWRWAAVCASGGSLLLAAGLFLVIPLTQMLNPPTEPDLIVREMRVVTPPVPPAPPPPPPEAPPPQSSQLQSLIEPVETAPIEFQVLDVEFAPGMGDAVAMGAPLPRLQLAGATIAAVEELFTFDDLAEVPRLVNMPRFRFPRGLVQRGVTEGKVIVEIDILPDGDARFRRIVSSSHPELEPVAREIVAQARFTRPMVDGVPRTVRGRFPLLLSH